MKRLALYAFVVVSLIGWFVLFGRAVIGSVREDVCDRVVSIPYETGSRPLCVVVERIEP